MSAQDTFERPENVRSTSIHPLVTLAVGAVLWYLPLLLFPLVGQPLTSILQMLGMLAPGAASGDTRFAVGMVVRWLAVMLLLLFVVGVERLPLRSIGIKRSKLGDVYWAAVLGWLGVVVGVGLFLPPIPDTHPRI